MELVPVSSVSAGRVIGSFRGAHIYDVIEYENRQYAFSRLLVFTNGDEFSLDQIGDGDFLILPGLIYSALPGEDHSHADAVALSASRDDLTSDNPDSTKRKNVAWEFAKSICGHLYKIGTFRPDFPGLSDTNAVLGIFFALFLLSGISHWLFFSDEELMAAFFKISISFVLVVFFTSKKSQSRTIMASWFGVEAIANLIASLFYLAGMTDSIFGFALLLYEVSLLVKCMRTFHFGDPAILKRGYKSTKPFLKK